MLKKYKQVWKRAEKLLKIKLHSERVYGDNDKFIQTKIKIYGGSVNTHFQGKKKCQKKKHYASLDQ